MYREIKTLKNVVYYSYMITSKWEVFFFLIKNGKVHMNVGKRQETENLLVFLRNPVEKLESMAFFIGMSRLDGIGTFEVMYL